MVSLSSPGRRGRLREIMLKGALDNRLLSCLVEVTRRCNHRCSHCFNDHPLPPGGGEMDTATLKGVLEQVAALGGLFLVFTGGEPLLRPDFLSLVSHARSLGFFLEIFSNGSLIDKKMAAHLARHGVGGVNISLYGGRDHGHVHDLITGVPGSHGLAIQAVSELVEAGVSVRANILVMQANRTCWEGAVALAKELGADHRLDYTILPSRSSGYATCDQLAVEWDTMVQVAGEVVDRGATGSRVADLKGVLDGLGVSYGDLPLCGAGRSSIHIHGDGTVWPCSIYPWQAGDLKEESLESIWVNSSVFHRLRSLNRGAMGDCEGCEFKMVCSTCPAMSAVEHGDPGRPASAVCARTKAMFAGGLPGGECVGGGG